MSEIDLILVRHAIAFERVAKKWPDDGQRPLTPEGERSFRKTARGLAGSIPPPAAVHTSPMVRARQTADILEEEAGWPEPKDLPELEADVGTETTLKALQLLERVGTLALVGHEPRLSELASLLLGGDVRFELKKGGVVRLRVSALEPGRATLRWLVPPKVLRAAAR